MEQVNCRNWPIIQITNSFAFAGGVQRGDGGEHPQSGCVPDFPGPPKGEWTAEGDNVFLFQLFPFQLSINQLLQDYVLQLRKDHSKIRWRSYFESNRGRSFLTLFLFLWGQNIVSYREKNPDIVSLSVSSWKKTYHSGVLSMRDKDTSAVREIFQCSSRSLSTMKGQIRP